MSATSRILFVAMTRSRAVRCWSAARRDLVDNLHELFPGHDLA
jgi:hypothetical protein